MVGRTSTERSRDRRARMSGGDVPQAFPEDVSEDIPEDTVHSLASNEFKKKMMEDEFGCACDVCDRLWFKKDLQRVREEHVAILGQEFEAVDELRVCASCNTTLKKGKIPTLSTTNGFKYPPKPEGLPDLDPISTRLISPRIPFMSIRRLTRDGQYGIIGQVINVPVDVSTMVENVPRQLDDDYSFNVSIKKKMVHKSSYLRGYVKKV